VLRRLEEVDVVKTAPRDVSIVEEEVVGFSNEERELLGMEGVISLPLGVVEEKRGILGNEMMATPTMT